jgi:hypothetical protein
MRVDTHDVGIPEMEFAGKKVTEFAKEPVG